LINPAATDEQELFFIFMKCYVLGLWNMLY